MTVRRWAVCFTFTFALNNNKPISVSHSLLLLLFCSLYLYWMHLHWKSTNRCESQGFNFYICLIWWFLGFNILRRNSDQKEAERKGTKNNGNDEQKIVTPTQIRAIEFEKQVEE